MRKWSGRTITGAVKSDKGFQYLLVQQSFAKLFFSLKRKERSSAKHSVLILTLDPGQVAIPYNTLRDLNLGKLSPLLCLNCEKRNEFVFLKSSSCSSRSSKWKLAASRVETQKQKIKSGTSLVEITLSFCLIDHSGSFLFLGKKCMFFENEKLSLRSVCFIFQ